MRDSKEIIRIIKKMRESKKMSVEELARRVGIAKSTQSRYESEQRDFPINDIGLYAEALDTTVEFLLDIGPIDKGVSSSPMSKHESSILHKYNSLDEIGKYTVDTALDAQYLRCIKPHHKAVSQTSEQQRTPNDEIITMAAHQIGHEGPLTPDQMEQIKRAMLNALAKQDE